MKRAEQELSEALAAAEEWRLRWEAGVKAARTAEAELQLAEQALKGGGASASDAELQAMRAPTLTPHPTPTPTLTPTPTRLRWSRRVCAPSSIRRRPYSPRSGRPR